MQPTHHAIRWHTLIILYKIDRDVYKRQAYDLAVQTGGETLPVTFKFGSDEQPEYHTFTQLEELKDQERR